MQKIEPLVRKCVPIPQKMHKITKRLRTPEEVEKHFPGFIAFMDCTEQQIPRPKNKERRKMYYSGKKKRHTIKNQLMVNNPGLIIHKSSHKKGKRHDYDIYKKNHPATPKQVVNVFDLGYLGVGKDFPGQISSLPNKKKRSQKDSVSRGKRVQPEPLQKEDSDRAHHLQDEKVQDNERYLQKQVEKVQQGIRYSVRTGKLQNIVIFLDGHQSLPY